MGLSKKVNIRFLAARILLEAGQTAKARELAAGLASDLNPEPRAYWDFRHERGTASAVLIKRDNIVLLQKT